MFVLGGCGVIARRGVPPETGRDPDFQSGAGGVQEVLSSLSRAVFFRRELKG